MLQQARDSLDFLGGADAVELQADRKTLAAVLNAVKTVGDASTGVSEAGRAEAAEVDWRGIKSMRNILVHEYGRVNTSILVATVRDDIPVLIGQLERLLQAEDSE